ncbi:fluoride efflux transporter FluC [Nocardia sp. CA-119907]|uniref:fluoride efflux transporter FluC n=1 Tax=Nocardia sp. CA-119907 TaxID=3239973 RepID=UPI003D963482
MPTPPPATPIGSDPFAARPRRARLREHVPILAVIALGGAIGATARYAASLLWPTAPRAFPWTVLLVNITGCAAMGALMVLIVEVWTAQRLLRPFLGTGVLGGYTTFSTYAAGFHHLVDTRHAAAGLIYLAATPILALTATWTTATLTHTLIDRRTR